MNTKSLSLASALLALSFSAFAQTATTDPVGFITATVAGGSLASPKLSLVSPTLTRPVVWQGLVASASTNTLTVSGVPWTADQFNGANGQYYVEVFSATKAGALSDITDTVPGSTTSSLTTFDNLSSYAVAGDSIRIRKHVTIADFLGIDNTYGLLGGEEASVADEVIVYDGAQRTIYFYFNGEGADPGWYDLNFDSADNAIIGPDEGVVIRRKAAGTVSIVSTGSVKTGDTLFSVRAGLNVLGSVSAKGLTLDNSGLYKTNGTALTAGEEASAADVVTIYSATGKKIYFYFNGEGADPGWYDLDFEAAGSTPLPVGSSFVVNRNFGGPFSWTLPAPSTF